MKGLLRNNFYSMQEGMKLSAVIVLFLGVMAVIVGNSLFVMAITIPIFIFSVNIGSSLQTDETSKWNKFEITLPVRRSTIIKCKYLSYLMLVLIGLFCSALIMLLFVIFGHEVEMMQVAFSYSFGISVAVLTGALMYPLILKFGASKSELVIIISVMGAVAFITGLWFAMRQILNFITGLGSAMQQILKGADNISILLGIVSLIASIIGFVLSYLISVRIHSKKEY